MKTKFLFVIVFLAMVFFRVNAEDIPNGKSLFMSRCAACHSVNKVLTGPALAGVSERRSLDWITQFVKSSQTVIKSGDTAAVTLFNKYNHVVMPDHPDVDKQKIQDLLAFINAESSVASAAPFSKPIRRTTLYKPITFYDYAKIIAYLFVVSGLAATLYFAVVAKKYQLARNTV